MLKINPVTKQIDLTRGDIANFKITAKTDDGTDYEFQIDDVVTLSIYEKKDFSNCKLKKSVEVQEVSDNVILSLTSEDTKIDSLINKPVDYWYELQLNGEQTIIGYDENGPKIFRLYPEGE